MAGKKERFDIICIGSALRDVHYYTDQMEVIDNPEYDPTREKLVCIEYGAKIRSTNVHFEYGGGASNTAVNFAGLGLQTGILTAVGNDPDGDAIVDHLQERHVHTVAIQKKDTERTGFSFLLVDEETSERTICIYYGASTQIDVNKKVLQAHATDWYYVSSLSGESWHDQMMAITQTGAHIAWNPGGKQLSAGYETLKDMLTAVTVLLVNSDEARELIISKPGTTEADIASPEIMVQYLHSCGPEVVVVTDGRDGAYVYAGNDVYYQASPKDHPVSIVGAGDCYGSSFIAGYIRYGGDIARAMELAQVNATSVIHRIGSQNGLLEWNDLPAHLKAV